MSVHKKTTQEDGIVTSGAMYSPRKRLWLTLAGATIVLLVVAGILFYWHSSNSPVPPSTKSNSKSPINNVQTVQQQIDAAVSKAQSELTAATSNTSKASAYKDLGRAYFNAGKYDQAIAAYNNAIGADDSIKFQVLDTLAYVYASAGQRDKAIATYQQLISLLQQQSNDGHTAKNYEGTDPNAAAIQIYQHSIQVLQQGGKLE